MKLVVLLLACRQHTPSVWSVQCCHLDLSWWLALQEPVLMVGRICCDSEGRLNERSVLLEGSVELSNGMRTKVDLSKLEGFKLFPGQVCTPCRRASIRVLPLCYSSAKSGNYHAAGSGCKGDQSSGCMHCSSPNVHSCARTCGADKLGSDAALCSSHW